MKISLKEKSTLYSLLFIIFAFLFGFYISKIINFNIEYRIMQILSSKSLKFLYKPMVLITFLGDEFIIMPAFLGIFAYFMYTKEKKYLYFLFVSVSLAFLLNYFMKNLFMRPRPVEFFKIFENRYSYPSGHSMISGSFYLSLGKFLSYKKSNKKYGKIFFSITIIIAFSRVYLGVHWPSDVIVGFILGYICASQSYLYLMKKELKK